MTLEQSLIVGVGFVGTYGALANGLRISGLVWREIGPIASISSTAFHAATAGHIFTRLVLGW